MRTAMLISLSLALAACASAPMTDQNGNFGAGTYQLVTLDDVALPTALPGQPGVEVVSGFLALQQDGQFEMRLDLRARLSTPGPVSYSRVLFGRYESSTIGLTLTWSDGSITDGAFYGQKVMIRRGGVDYMFH